MNYIGECPFDDYLRKWNFNGFKAKHLRKYVDEWVKLYKSGISVTLISKAYNCSETQINNFFSEINIQKNSIIDRLYRWIIDYDAGKSIDAIAEESNCTRESVIKIIDYVYSHQNDFDFKKKKGVSKTKGKWVAGITINNKFKYLGIFDDYEDAVNARINGEDVEYQEWLKEQQDEESNKE